ncbi:condensation domain-containing protein, partial [Nocardiopsis rhodophaea]|uniref:condensation domain-containing protein n=1 Tax=Nocardiopsis rhodophaea TaxID=280238 RepID=UPI0031DB5E36
ERLYLEGGDLPAKTTSFAGWTQRLAEHAHSEHVTGQADYWERVAASISPLPVDHNIHDTARTHRLTLPADTTAELLQAAQEMRARPDELVLTACAQALTCWAGQDAITVDVEGHGRERLFDDVNTARTVGWFTALRPVPLNVGRTSTAEAVRVVKEALREAPDNGIGYGLLRAYTDLLPDTPDAPVLFNYLGHIDQSGDAFALRFDEGQTDAAYSLENRRHHAIEINAGLYQDQMVVDLEHDPGGLSGTTAEELLDGVRRYLIELTSPDCHEVARTLVPSDFPLAHLDSTELDRIGADHGSAEDLLPATPMQRGLLFHTLAAPDSGVYTEQIRLLLTGHLDVPRLRDAWQRTVRRHPALRTALAWTGLATPHQVVHPEVDAPIEVLDWTAVENADDRIAVLLREDRTAGFDLSAPPLMRLHLIRVADNTWEFLWSHHHVLLDGWSASLVLDDFFGVYRAMLSGGQPAVSMAPPYRDYVAWLEEQDLGRAETYWRSHLAGFTEPTRLGNEQAAALVTRRPEAAEATAELPQELSDRVRTFAREHGLTLNTVLMGVWSLLLSRYSGKDDLVFGVTSAGRPAEIPDVERMVGLFINTLPARVHVAEERRVVDWLRSLQETETERRQYENTPLAKVQEWSDALASTSLFDHILVVENYLLDDEVFQIDRDLRVSDYRAYEQTNYLLALVIEPRDHLILRTRHDPDRLAAEAVDRFLDHFEVLLKGMIADADQEVGRIPLLSVEEYDTVVRGWNATAEDFGAAAAGCLHEKVWD